MRIIHGLFTLIVCVCLALNVHANERRTVKVGSMSWEDIQPMSKIGKKFLEKENHAVQYTQFSEWGIAYTALVRGDIDLLVSHVDYVASDYWRRNKQRLEKVSIVSHGLRQGIIVPSYMPISSLEELNSVRDQVGGRIIGVEPGSGLMREVSDAVKQYKLDYTVIDGSTAAMAAQLQSALERKQPIVTMIWEPSWMSQKFDTKFLEDPKQVFAPPQAYFWIARKGFSAENPHTRETLASMYIPISDINKINDAVKEGATEDQAVEAWWTDNTDLIERWSQMSSK